MPIERLANNPIIDRALLAAAGDSANTINGPSLITAPPWLDNPLGKYYLYFADHCGKHIKLAYADQLDGPWTIYPPGTLQLQHAVGCEDHIASPDVHVDSDNRQVRLYFHGVERSSGEQKSFLALSTDGLHFTACRYPIADFYLRAIRYQDRWLAMSKGGTMYRSQTGIADFKPLNAQPFPRYDRLANAPGSVRHVALQLKQDTLLVYYSRIGDQPESILRAAIDLTAAENDYRAQPPETLLTPEHDWEGALLAAQPSRAGPAHSAENGLRDPAIFEQNGRSYLLYATAGEQGIAIAQIKE